MLKSGRTVRFSGARQRFLYGDKMITHVNRFLTYLEEEQERSANTAAAYRNDLSQFTRFVTDGCRAEHPPVASWAEVDPPLVDGYVAWLRHQPYAPATVARKVAALKSFFYWMEQNAEVRPNPAERVESPKVKRAAPRPIHADQIERLLAEPGRDESPAGLRDKALVETLYATGLRVSEVVALNLDDLQLEAGALHCGGRHSRSVPLPAVALQALRRWVDEGRPQLAAQAGDDALFLNHRGQRLTRQGLWLIIKRAVRQVGIEATVTPHTLRQSFAAHQLRGGAELSRVAELLGHASTQTTQAYRRSAVEPAPDRLPVLTIDGRPWIDDAQPNAEPPQA